MIRKFISYQPKIITGSIRSIDRTNISYIEPHRIIYNKSTFLFFNFTNEVYVEDLNNKNSDLGDSHHLLKSILNKRKEEHLDLVTHLAKQSNSKDSDISKNIKN